MKQTRTFASLGIAVVLLVLPVACGQGTPTAADPTATQHVVQVFVVATNAPFNIPVSTLTATPTPTQAPTTRPTATRTRTPTRKPTAKPTNTSIPQPTPIPGPAQICADWVAQGRNELNIVYVEPSPELIWDTNPRMFRVGICNSVRLPAVPQGRYRIFIYFPGSRHGRAQSGTVPATLSPGLNEVHIGPWIPGLENHRAACNDRPIGEIEVEYDGSGAFDTLLWADGKSRIGLPIKCGGDYA